MRDPTRTIETLDFQYGKARFRVLDVGGQRMERPKWNLTGEITAVIFVCALTEYNQVLREDIKQNRLKESINLFDPSSYPSTACESWCSGDVAINRGDAEAAGRTNFPTNDVHRPPMPCHPHPPHPSC